MKKIIEDKYLSAICILLTTTLYAVLVYDRGMPFPEGWYSAYSKFMQEGLLPYRDFEYLYTPAYLTFVNLYTSIVGMEIIKLRILGVIVYTGIGWMLYLSMRQIFGNLEATVGSIVATLYLQSEAPQLFYDYIRVLDLLNMVWLYLTIKILRKEYSNYIVYINGVILAIILFVKQNVGALNIACMIFILALFFLLFPNKREFYINTLKRLFVAYGMAIAIAVAYMFFSGALDGFIICTSGEALNAKGGFYTVMFGWLRGVYSAAGIFKDKLLIIVEWLALTYFLADKFGEESNEKTERKLLIATCMMIFISIIISISNEELCRWVANQKKLNPYLIFLVCNICLIYYFVSCYIKRNKNEIQNSDAIVLVPMIVYDAISFASGNCGGLVEGQATIGFAFLICIFIRRLKFRGGNYIKIIILAICVFVSLESIDKKLIESYTWWGADSGSYFSAKYETDIPALKGIYLSKETKKAYEGICNIVEENTSDEDDIFCFPQIPIFYVLTNRNSPDTFAKVQWFDVSADKTLVNDMEIIKKNPPKVIIMYCVNEPVYDIHEKAFRQGRKSGTRYMKEELTNLIIDDYRLGDTFFANHNIIQVWIRKAA